MDLRNNSCIKSSSLCDHLYSKGKCPSITATSIVLFPNSENITFLGIKIVLQSFSNSAIKFSGILSVFGLSLSTDHLKATFSLRG